MVDQTKGDDPKGWTVHTKHHWSRTHNGHRLDYWPNRKRFEYRGQVMFGNVTAFMRDPDSGQIMFGDAFEKARAVATLLTPDGVKEKLVSAVKEAGSQRDWAYANGVSEQYVCDVIQGRRGIGEKLAQPLGYRPVTMYEPLTD